MSHSPITIAAAEAMRKKRAELIAQPLDRIWRDLAEACLQEAAAEKRREDLRSER